MREFIIQEDDANQRLDKFLLKSIPKLPKSFMYKAIRNKKIKINRKRCEINTRLQVNDHIQCFISEDFFEDEIYLDFLKVPSLIHVIYEDDQILIMDKEKNMLSHKDINGIQDNQTDRFLHYLYDHHAYDPYTHQSFTPALCHRLDKNTSGLIIGAKKAEALRRINMYIKNRQIHKYYICIVEGVMEKDHDRILLWHKKNVNNKVEIIDHAEEGYVQVDTSYRLLQQKKHHALLEIELHTGKSHQIRSVLSYLHHPIYGDVKYGAKINHRDDFQALCAYKIQFDFVDDYLENISNSIIQLPCNRIQSIFDELT